MMWADFDQMLQFLVQDDGRGSVFEADSMGAKDVHARGHIYLYLREQNLCSIGQLDDKKTTHDPDVCS